ncbi:laccase-14-like [Pyrus ussuriensis x Pyrus communis]|uniref:Laccase-14-like n=1 Tax=Pyrus ussuriensis x Pyrus communis TaxID=2448454 RepID=A0A5N5FKP2_9ROSA|nr:laccase-14-like [Pyrus ussuriensis x Pyrus communis]
MCAATQPPQFYCRFFPRRPFGTTQLDATLCKLRNCSELLSVSLVYKLCHNDLKDVILFYRRNEMGRYDSLIFWSVKRPTASPQFEAPAIRFQSYKHCSYLSTGLYRYIPGLASEFCGFVGQYTPAVLSEVLQFGSWA